MSSKKMRITELSQPMFVEDQETGETLVGIVARIDGENEVLVMEQEIADDIARLFGSAHKDGTSSEFGVAGKLVEFWADFTMDNGDVIPFYLNGTDCDEGDDFAKTFTDSLMDDIEKMISPDTKHKILTSYDHFHNGRGAGGLVAIRVDKISSAMLRYNIVDRRV